MSDGDGNYPPNSNCQFRVTSGSPIELRFDSINLELNYDFVKVYDGSSDQAPLLIAATGTAASPVISTSETVFIVFSSDASVQGSGFVASYSSITRRMSGVVPKATETNMWQHPAMVTVLGVLVVAVASVGTILIAQKYKSRRKFEGSQNSSYDANRFSTATWIASRSTELDLDHSPYNEDTSDGRSNGMRMGWI